MWKGSVLVAALAVALTAIAGVAVASVGSSDDTALTSDDTAVTQAASTDDAVDEEASTTTTSTTAPAADDSSSVSDTASMSDDEDGEDDDSGSMTGTTTNTTMGDLDDDYDDDYSDDDDEYVMIADGVYPIDASPYGSVTVEVRDGMLYLVSIDVDSVWMLHEREEKSDEVELEFYWGESELKIKVEVDDGQLKKMVEFDMKDDDDDYSDDDDDDYSDDDDEYVMVADGVYPIDVSPYGTVTVEVRDGMLYLTSIDVDSVWMLDKREEKSDEVELGFYWGESELKIKVEVDDGQLKKMVEFDLK